MVVDVGGGGGTGGKCRDESDAGKKEWEIKVQSTYLQRLYGIYKGVFVFQFCW